MHAIINYYAEVNSPIPNIISSDVSLDIISPSAHCYIIVCFPSLCTLDGQREIFN